MCFDRFFFKLKAFHIVEFSLAAIAIFPKKSISKHFKKISDAIVVVRAIDLVKMNYFSDQLNVNLISLNVPLVNNEMPFQSPNQNKYANEIISMINQNMDLCHIHICGVSDVTPNFNKIRLSCPYKTGIFIDDHCNENFGARIKEYCEKSEDIRCQKEAAVLINFAGTKTIVYTYYYPSV